MFILVQCRLNIDFQLNTSIVDAVSQLFLEVVYLQEAYDDISCMLINWNIWHCFHVKLPTTVGSVPVFGSNYLQLCAWVQLPPALFLQTRLLLHRLSSVGLGPIPFHPTPCLHGHRCLHCLSIPAHLQIS